MPIHRCKINGKPGYKWGDSGKCYVGFGARKKAERQAAAIHASGWAENARSRARKRPLPRAPNPLRRDPTRTVTLRRLFARDLRRRLTRVQQAVVDLLVKEDAFGLTPRVPNPVTNARFQFQTTPDQVEAFRTWLKAKLLAEVIGERKDDWWQRYVREGYQKGAARAFEDVQKRRWGPHEGDFYQGTKEQFLRSSFGRPVAVEKAKLLAGRVYTELSGVTESMATRMTRTLTDGLVQGQNPREIARHLNNDVEELGKSRALMIARTEIVRCHAEGQLDALEELGVEEVGVMVEWSTSEMGETELGNPSPCKECAALAGSVLRIEEAHGLLPRHPNCMCSFIPANVGEETRGQKRTKGEIQQAFRDSIRAEIPKTSKRTLAEQKKRTSWGGSDKSISRRRPTSALETNVFCPTGEGGGIDPTCSPKGGGRNLVSSSNPTEIDLASSGMFKRLAKEYKDGSSEYPAPPSYWIADKLDESPTISVKFKELIATQTEVNREKVQEYLAGKQAEKPVIVLRVGKKLFVVDGHTRIAAAWSKGENSVEAKVVSLEE